jgi:hypothetical protein
MDAAKVIFSGIYSTFADASYSGRRAVIAAARAPTCEGKQCPRGESALVPVARIERAGAISTDALQPTPAYCVLE